MCLSGTCFQWYSFKSINSKPKLKKCRTSTDSYRENKWRIAISMTVKINGGACTKQSDIDLWKFLSSLVHILKYLTRRKTNITEIVHIMIAIAQIHTDYFKFSKDVSGSGLQNQMGVSCSCIAQSTVLVLVSLTFLRRPGNVFFAKINLLSKTDRTRLFYISTDVEVLNHYFCWN